MQQNSIFSDLYDLPHAPPFNFWRAVLCQEHDGEILAVRDSTCGGSFPILDYLAANKICLKKIATTIKDHCHAKVDINKQPLCNLYGVLGANSLNAGQGEYAQITGDAIGEELQNGCGTFLYNDTEFRLYTFTYQMPSGNENKMSIFTWQQDLLKGKSLIADVFNWANELREEFWVFHGLKGGWRKDKAFFAAVQSADARELMLSQSTMTDLQRDTTGFFDCQSLYQELNIPWKRGILLMGPPGNGKTGAIKVLAKACAEQRIPILYVQTAKTRLGLEFGITAIFEKARSEAPCVLVLEDIETLVSDETRTMLLNQLDGVERNDGILVIATANDASKLDAAILQRPSRFDTKYFFDLPDQEMRKRFIKHWLQDKKGLKQASLTEKHPAIVDELATLTHGWSFAFLKELFMSILIEQVWSLSCNRTIPGIESIELSCGLFTAKAKELQAQMREASVQV